MRISDGSSDVCSSNLIVLVHIGDAKQRQIRIATAQNERCQTFSKALDSDGYAFRAKHAARAAGRGWLLFTTVVFVAHWRQQPCFASSFAPIWTSAAILVADPHLWLRQYLQEVGTWSGKTNFDHLPGHGEYFGNRLQIGAQAGTRTKIGRASCRERVCPYV